MIQEYQFGPWLPELTDYKNPGLEVVENAIPSPSGYQPAYGTVSVSTAVSGTVIGSIGLERRDGTSVVCVATTTDLWVITGGTATASSLSLSLNSTDRVVFEQFDGQVYATTKDGDTWYLTDIETDTSFSAVAGTVPQGNGIGRVADFLVMGDLTDIDATNKAYRVRWSQFNNPAGDWSTSKALQADFQDMDASQGPVTAISGGTFGLVFQKNGVSRMDYNGRASVFSFNLYEKNRGCVAGRSVARVGDLAYFLSLDGFSVTDGASVQSISQGKIWSWFLETANQTFIDDVIASINWERRCVVWAFAGGADRTYTHQIWYNWETQNWGHVKQEIQALIVASKPGETLEGISVIYPNLDTMAPSLDSAIFRASGRTMLALVGGMLSEFSGSTLETLFSSGSLQPIVGQRSFIRSITPLIANEASGTSVSIGTRERMTKQFLTSAEQQVGSLGFAPFNEDGRYFRVNIRIPAGEEWSDAYGFQAEYEPSGQW